MSLNHTSSYSQLTEQHFAAIGKLMVEFSNIDFLLRSILVRLLLTPSFPGRTYTDTIPAGRIQAALEEAIELHRVRYNWQIVDRAVLNELEALLRKVSKLRGTRNALGHFCWARNTDEEIIGFNFSGGLLHTKKHEKSVAKISLKQAASLHAEAYELVENLTAIIQQIPELEEEGIKKKLKHLPTA